MSDQKPPGGRKPITPSPTAMVIALAMVSALVYNVHLDAAPGDYNGLYVTGILAALIAGVLGFDLKFPGGRGDE